MIVIRRNVGTHLQVIITFHKWFALRYLLSAGLWFECRSRVNDYIQVSEYVAGRSSRLMENNVTDAGHNYTITVRPRET